MKKCKTCKSPSRCQKAGKCLKPRGKKKATKRKVRGGY